MVKTTFLSLLKEGKRTIVMNRATTQEQKPIVTGQDVARWLTFSGFWGFVFYLLSLVSMLIGHRRQPAQLNTKNALVALGLHVGTFVTIGSAFSAAVSFKRGRSTSELAQESTSSGQTGSNPLQTGASAAAGSPLPFALAAASTRMAGSLTGQPTFPEGTSIDWLRAAGTNAVFTGITAMAVSRIAGWVAQDARRESITT